MIELHEVGLVEGLPPDVAKEPWVQILDAVFRERRKKELEAAERLKIYTDAGGDNAVSSLKYRVTATHGAGVTAKDNLGADSSPVVAIAAGSKTKDTAAYTPYRNYFYGTSATTPTVDSAYVRTLTKSNKAYD